MKTNQTLAERFYDFACTERATAYARSNVEYSDRVIKIDDTTSIEYLSDEYSEDDNRDAIAGFFSGLIESI